MAWICILMCLMCLCAVVCLCAFLCLYVCIYVCVYLLMCGLCRCMSKHACACCVNISHVLSCVHVSS